MHVFLTGEIQVGKSTAIKKCLQELAGTNIRGFLTVSKNNDRNADRPVYIIPAAEENPIFSEERICLNRTPSRFEPRPQVFDSVGIDILKDAESGDLILMDEIGRAESAALLFRSRIEELLNCSVPILGVLQKKAEPSLSDIIKNHPNVRVVTVTEENRNDIPEIILGILNMTSN